MHGLIFLLFSFTDLDCHNFCKSFEYDTGVWDQKSNSCECIDYMPAEEVDQCLHALVSADPAFNRSDLFPVELGLDPSLMNCRES
jgi:hypothetical protein